MRLNHYASKIIDVNFADDLEKMITEALLLAIFSGFAWYMFISEIYLFFVFMILPALVIAACLIWGIFNATRDLMQEREKGRD